MEFQRYEMAGLGRYRAEALVEAAVEDARDSDDLDRPLWVIEAIIAAQAKLELDLREWVLHARGCGETWDEIGDALGVSKQAAAKKYGAGK